MKEFILKDVRKKLVGYDREVDGDFEEYSARYMDRDKRIGYPDSMFLFLDILCSTLPDIVSIDEFMLNIELLINDLEKGKCGFHNSSVTEKRFENLKEILEVHGDLPQVMSFIPRYIETVTDEEFSIEFSKRFAEEILGQQAIDDNDVDYGYIEIDKNTIDISNKDKADVLAALYNSSQPVGMGMAQYDPTPMTKEVAEKILEKEKCFSYLLGRPLYIRLDDNKLFVGAYNRDNGKNLAQRAISKCRNINDIGKEKIKTPQEKLEEEIKKRIKEEIVKKQREKNEQTVSNTTYTQRSGLEHIDVSSLPPLRRLVEEQGYNISEETLEFIKRVEDEAYPEEMKLMQDIDMIEELEDIYGYYTEELTIARNNDWYIIYGDDEDSIEIVDIASLPTRERVATQEIHNYITRVINQKAHNDHKPVTLSAKEDTSYRMIQRMVRNGEYEIIDDTPDTWEDNDEIIMHNLVLTPIIQRDRGEI
jgi:hypothetical protein